MRPYECVQSQMLRIARKNPSDSKKSSLPSTKAGVITSENNEFLKLWLKGRRRGHESKTPGMAGSAHRGPRPLWEYVGSDGSDPQSVARDLLTPRFRADIWGTQFREIL